MKHSNLRLAATTWAALLASPARAQADLLVADFEAPDYGHWQVTGEAFGSGPSTGALPKQIAVLGFKGKSLVNSSHNGDASTGSLTSPAFKIQRKFISFLIGGGKDSGRICLNLLINGKVVRTATGPEAIYYEWENMEPMFWDVGEFAGQSAVIQMVDQATGRAGHLLVDHLVQTDRQPAVANLNVTRELTLEKNYLNLPVKTGGPKRKMSVAIEGQEPREFTIELADGEPDWWAFMDIGSFRGKKATITVNKLSSDSTGLSSIDESDQIKNADTLYHEKLRPQFHFSARRGWTNDPNGLVFYKGEYHLFFQHNPYGWAWANMQWGHAVSTDLVHWKELPDALYPDKLGWIYSGSTVVDWNNTAGFQTGEENALVAIYTSQGSAGFQQSIAYSNDRGRSWTKYDGNPVLPVMVGGNRDPKVVWYAPEDKWVMALFLNNNDFALLSSKDLKKWEHMSKVTIPECGECPEIFEIAMDGNNLDTRWIFYGGNGRYLVGKFDGTTFTRESGPHSLHSGNAWYASQTFSDIPAGDGRRILMAWGQVEMPGMPFNQMMSAPVSLTLRRTDEGPRLHSYPVKEFASLRRHSLTIPPRPLKPGDNPLADLKGELLDITAEITLGTATEVGFKIRGLPVVYRTDSQTLNGNALKPVDGRIRLRLLADRVSLDVFANDGRLYMPMGAKFLPDNPPLELFANGGSATINSLEVHELKSAWPD
jgi:sucrose-6-phosphate hydrolase SacC (GH32 family)